MESPGHHFDPTGLTLNPYDATHRGACVAVFDSNLPEFVTEPERGQFEAFLLLGACPYFVVMTMNDGIVACGGFDAQPDHARLCWGLVRRDLHRRGIGRFLLTSRLRRIYDECGDTVVRMDTSQLTCAFFERLGFRVVDRIEHGYRANLHKMEMELQLDAQAVERLRLA